MGRVNQKGMLFYTLDCAQGGIVEGRAQVRLMVPILYTYNVQGIQGDIVEGCAQVLAHLGWRRVVVRPCRVGDRMGRLTRARPVVGKVEGDDPPINYTVYRIGRGRF